jgi:GNAT superfamily N-acetyltransferase
MLPWSMRIDLYEPALIDERTARELAAVHNAAAAIDASHLAPVSGEHVRLRLRHGDDDRPLPYLFVAVDGGGHVVGCIELGLHTWDNPHVASIDLETHPDVRGLGVDDQLYAAVLARVQSLGKSLLLADAWAGSSREAFWQRHGFSVGCRDAQRRLVIADLDWPRLDALHDESVAASEGYDIVAFPTPAPPQVVAQLLELQRAINDSPIDDLQIDEDVWTEDRLRGYERAMSARGNRLHRLVARRRADGELGGHTLVAVEHGRPNLGFQEDTAVAREHRGHRLGLRLKIEMLRRLAQLEPQIERIDTWNAESNTHMLAVNDALGCVVVGRDVELQKRLSSTQAQSWPSSRSSASSIVPS